MQIEPLALDTLLTDNARIDYGTEEELRLLGESLKRRQLEAIQVGIDGKTVTNGNRRVKAGRLVGMTHLNAVKSNDPVDTPTLRRLQLAFDANCKHLTPYEVSMALIEGRKPGQTGKALAEEIGKDQTLVSKYLSAEKLCPEALEAYKRGDLGLKDMVSISQLPHAEQPVLLELKLKGASAEQVAKAGRKRRSGEDGASTEQVNGIRLPLGSDFSFTVKGPKLSLDLAIEKAEAAVERLKAAKRDGHTAETIKEWLANKPPKKARKPRKARS